jgi:hypothetical protein
MNPNRPEAGKNMNDDTIDAVVLIATKHTSDPEIRLQTDREIRALLSASKPDYSQCCDTSAFCSSVRRCTAKDAAAPSPAQTDEPTFKEFRAALARFNDANTPVSIADRVMILSNATFLLDEYARTALQAAPAAENERLETMSENIARDIREGRFPQRSEPQTIGTAPQQAADTPEGCAVADAKMLREANHALAAENELLRKRLRPFAHLVGSGELSWAMVEYCVKDDPEKQTFQAPQMQRAFNRAAEAYRNAAPQPAADAPGMAEPVAWVVEENGIPTKDTYPRTLDWYAGEIAHLPIGTKLYTAPQPVAQTFPTEDQRETIERAIEVCNSVQMFATAKGLREILTVAQPVEQTRALTEKDMDKLGSILFTRFYTDTEFDRWSEANQKTKVVFINAAKSILTAARPASGETDAN